MKAVDQETGFIMTQVLLQWYVTLARMFISVTVTTFLLVESENSQIKNLLPLKANDIILQALAQSNGYGVMTPENCTSTLLKMYFFSLSPINILSVNCFAQNLNDMTGTGINTQKLKSRFYWDSNKFLLKIQYLPSNLPEIFINEGFALSTIFCALVSIVVNVTNYPRYGCCFTHMDADDDK